MPGLRAPLARIRPANSTEEEKHFAPMMTAKDQIEAMHQRRASATELVCEALDAARSVGVELNAIAHLFEAEASAEAIEAEQRYQEGRVRPLEGVPILLKDMTPTFGQPTTRGSFVEPEATGPCEAEIARRLKEAGAIVIGKTTTAEYAFSSFTRSVRFGDTKNPWDPARTSGGSSGGSAVGVSTGIVPLAEGSDMGGSVRIPAAACGVIGFKPSLGLIPMDILPTAIDTISHYGALARSIEDIVLFVQVTAGHYPRDMMSWPSRFDPDLCAAQPLSRCRFALSMDLGYCDVSPEVASVIQDAADALVEAGATVEPVDLAWTRAAYDQWADRWYSLLNLFPETQNISNLAKMDPGLANGILAAQRLPASKLMDLERLRTSMNEDLCAIFENYDALLCPTNAVTAPPLEMTDQDFEQDRPNGKLGAFDMCHPFNLVSTCPVVSVPVGLASDGLPVGMQVVGSPHANEAALSFAASIMSALPPLPLPSRHT